MTVVLTSPVEGLQPGANYTGANEAYLLAAGYAKQASYTGPGVANTGAAHTTVANNREFDATRGTQVRTSGSPKTGTNESLVMKTSDEPIFANEPAENITAVNDVTPARVPLAGQVVKINGRGFSDVTGVTFGGTAGTSFSKTERVITVTAPAKAAGTYDVVLTDPDGNVTKAQAITYAA